MQTRKPLRLSNYDYSQNGVYFVTVCTKDKAHLLGSVVGAGVPTGPHRQRAGIRNSWFFFFYSVFE